MTSLQFSAVISCLQQINEYNRLMIVRVLTICFAFLAFNFTLSCGGCERFTTSSSTSVLVEPVKVRESSPTVIVPGILIPRDKVEIKLSNAGKLAEVFVNKGDIVKEGAVLARLAEDELSLKANQLRAAKKDAETLLEKNQYLFKNRDRLLEEGKIDKTQYDGMAIELASAETDLERIKADLAVVEYNLAHIQITTPVGGVVVEKYASPMQMAGENQVLFVIMNIDPILVSFPLTADESSSVRMGMPINIKVEDIDDGEYKGTVTYIGPVVNQPGMTFDVWAQVPNPDYVLKSGMQATADFISTNIHKVIVVPKSAIFSRDRDRFVFTVMNGAARQTKVSIRTIHDDIAEISKGLAENDLVVVKGANGLQDGSPVEMWRR